MAGAPTKYQSQSRQQRQILWDGPHDAWQLVDCISPDFSSEKELADHVEDNIAEFCADGLGVAYEKHVREFPLARTIRSRRGNRRIDFLVVTKTGERIGIECKHPLYRSELAAGIGQLLAYFTLYERMDKPFDRLVLAATQLDPNVAATIHRFSLPISYVILDKSKFLTYNLE